MSSFLLYATSLCCFGDSNNQDNTPNKIVVEVLHNNPLIDKFNDDIMIWALKHHISKKYTKSIQQKNCDSCFIDKINIESYNNREESKNVQIKENLNIAEFTSEMNFDFKKFNLTNFNETIPLLNLNGLQMLNYDSEKEFYIDSRDKLLKIKKLFESVK